MNDKHKKAGVRSGRGKKNGTRKESRRKWDRNNETESS